MGPRNGGGCQALPAPVHGIKLGLLLRKAFGITKPLGLVVGSWAFTGVFLVLALVVFGTSGVARWSWARILLLASLPIMVFASRRAASRRRCVESGPSLTGC